MILKKISFDLKIKSFLEEEAVLLYSKLYEYLFFKYVGIILYYGVPSSASVWFMRPTNDR